MKLLELHKLIEIQVGYVMLSEVEVTVVDQGNIEQNIQDLIFCEECHRYHILLAKREG